MRLAFLFRRPLPEVLGWPASHIQLYAQYLSREPAPDERIEYAVAQLTAVHVNSNRRRGSPPTPLSEFMLFRDAWKRDEEDEMSFEEFGLSIGGVKRAPDHR